MLPGFRFLFAAIVLSMSILVFGLGAAALLRAAHEEFASTPAWHATPETMFARQNEATRPVLALLRIEAPAELKAPDVPAETAPVVVASTTVEPEAMAPPKPEDSSPPEIPISEAAPPVETALADVPASADTKVAAIDEVSPPANEAVAAAPESASAPVSPEIALASTKIAMLGGPAVTIEPPPAVSADPDTGTVKKRRQAERAKTHRRLAQRTRLTAQAPQQPTDAFGQPTITVRKR
jgi:hypothetical protein